MATSTEFTLLCETCGYVLEGLAEEGNCPECGRAIASSLPSARAGTPWDRGPSVRSWFATGWMVVTRPGRTFERVRIDRPQLGGLFVANVIAGAALATIPMGIAVARWLWREFTEAAIAVPIAILIPAGAWALVALLFVLLTSIERTGLVIIGRAHRWRVTWTVTASVCELASAGWVIAGLAVGLTSLIPLFVERRVRYRWLGPWAEEVTLGVCVGAALIGLLIFETLVYIGVRRCKFANRARPA